MVFPEKLRTIQVSTINQTECQKVYHNITPVTELNFCTHDEDGHKRSCHGDSGGPFVINNKLAGIMSWSHANQDVIFPDIFVNLAHPKYHRWIESYVPLNH